MGFAISGRGRAVERLGAAYRAQHSMWLSRALAGRMGTIPPIPRRRVADGGYAGLMASSEGRAWAEGWWTEAFEELERSK